jgi:hypothetical protein
MSLEGFIPANLNMHDDENINKAAKISPWWYLIYNQSWAVHAEATMESKYYSKTEFCCWFTLSLHQSST